MMGLFADPALVAMRATVTVTATVTVIVTAAVAVIVTVNATVAVTATVPVPVVPAFAAGDTAGLAAKLAGRAPNSIRKTKRLMRDAEQLWSLMQREGEAFGSQLSSPEAMEAFVAFGQKRAPRFA